MPATGGGRAAHAAPAKRSEKSKSVESMQSTRRGSVQASASAPAQRPGVKGRAYSTPLVPKSQDKGAEDNASLYSMDGEEIANDAFFQRYLFTPPVGVTKVDDASEPPVVSSSDSEGPLSPTHIKNRQPAGDVPSEASSAVCCYFAPWGAVSSLSADA